MDPQKITELANLLRQNGDKILSSEFKLTLSGAFLRALNDSFTLIADSAVDFGGSSHLPHSSSASNHRKAPVFEVLKPKNLKSSVFSDLQLIHDFVQKTTLLCIVQYANDELFEGAIDIGKFHALQRLEVQKTPIKQVVGIQRLRSQLQELICVRSLHSVDEIVTHCGGDQANGFVWNELKYADFSYNQLKSVDSSLEFAQYLQHLNLRHNQLQSVTAIKWLPNLKTLDLSFNRLSSMPQFHSEACKRLQTLNMSNNFVEDLMGIVRLDALTDLDLADNCLMEHSSLLPLSVLMTLKFLNLYGNPLYCHPKHRLATAQFLHKNTSTVKFILDFEPLSKNEKAITGKQQMRHVGSLNSFLNVSSATTISTSRASLSNQQTPSSSVGSRLSFRLFDYKRNESVESVSSQTAAAAQNSVSSKKRSSKKTRNVDIEDDSLTKKATEPAKQAQLQNTAKPVVNGKLQAAPMDSEMNSSQLLETRQHIATLREKYGAEWLQGNNAEMMQSVLGIENQNSNDNASAMQASRLLFNEFLAEDVHNTAPAASDSMLTSTPTNDSVLHSIKAVPELVSPIKPAAANDAANAAQETGNATLYMSMDQTNVTAAASLYQSLEHDSDESKLNNSQQAAEQQHNLLSGISKISTEIAEYDEAPHLKDIYSTDAVDEPEVSETEEDEGTYIVYDERNPKDSIFLTISGNYLREKDTVTQCTKTKWSINILESCERIKSNTILIHFDTVQSHKAKRVYIIEDGLCQDLEKRLRNILSKRNLKEMNQTIYRCVNCSCKFSQEKKFIQRSVVIRCPECRSTFVAEIQNNAMYSNMANRLAISSADIAEEKPSTSTVGITVKDKHQLDAEATECAEETNSIGSANSLNESSSCSKLTHHSQSSFDSNQSVVGSSNTDRDNEFRYNDSDVDIISNPSQSSIEVLEQIHERRVSHVPNLETIDDQSYSQSFIEREFGNYMQQNKQLELTNAADTAPKSDAENEKAVESAAAAANAPLAIFNLTESSSSGSVTDSICTTYEQKAQDKTLTNEPKAAPAHDLQQQVVIHNMLLKAEQQNANGHAAANDVMQKSSSSSSSDKALLSVNTAANANGNGNDVASNTQMPRSDSGLSSMFGVLFQSTNKLMSSSKKLIDAEATTGTIPPSASMRCQPYKFNYSDFNDIDHRLKLFFYQNKFEEAGEHFKLLLRAQIYAEQLDGQQLFEGLLVITTCKCYIMQIIAAENDDVSKWLRQLLCCSFDRLQAIQLLPWKMGVSLRLRDYGEYLLLLQDIGRTSNLMLYLQNNSLPAQCELIHQPNTVINQRLLRAISGEEKLNMCTLLNDCEVVCGPGKRQLNLCTLLSTDSHLYLSAAGKVGWLTSSCSNDDNDELVLCLTQLMGNLVDVIRKSDTVCNLNFLDETQNKCELWTCTFATAENADSCLNAIAQSWEQLFGVSLLSS